jgi:hypothetical protein
MLTFGKTDMARFYSEQRAPITMRIVGAGFLLFGTIFLCEAGFPFGGPSPLKASFQAKEYLSAVYESPGRNWRLSPKRESNDDTILILDYQFGSHSGSLRAQWQRDKYRFSEIENR